MEEKKNKKGLGPGFMVILVVLFLVGGVLGFAASKLLDEPVKESNTEEKEKKEEKKEPVVTNYAVTDEKVANLIKNIDVGALENCNGFEDYANDKKVESKDVSSLKAYRIGEREFYDSKKQSVSLDEFTKAIQKYLGKDYKYVPLTDGDEKDRCISYVYDESTKTYKFQQTACGGTCGPTTDYKLVKAVDTDGVLKLDVKVIFASYEDGKMGYYSDYSKTSKIGTFEESIDPLYDKGSDYQFTFKLEDGNYVFVSSEPVK